MLRILPETLTISRAIIGQRGSLRAFTGISYFQKSYFWNYADHAETVSGKLVDFRKTRFHDSARVSARQFFSFIDPASLWRAESSGSQPVYRKLFPHGPHSSKNNFFEIKISQRRDSETPSLSY